LEFKLPKNDSYIHPYGLRACDGKNSLPAGVVISHLQVNWQPTSRYSVLLVGGRGASGAKTTLASEVPPIFTSSKLFQFSIGSICSSRILGKTGLSTPLTESF
jgi:hypothetical protein